MANDAVSFCTELRSRWCTGVTMHLMAHSGERKLANDYAAMVRICPMTLVRRAVGVSILRAGVGIIVWRVSFWRRCWQLCSVEH